MISKTILRKKRLFECPNCGQFYSTDFGVIQSIQYFNKTCIGKDGEEVIGLCWYNCKRCGVKIQQLW